LWLKETVGFALNVIDSETGELEQMEFVAKVASMVENPFYLSRYYKLKNADYTDDITTVNPNELLGGGQPVAPEDEVPGPQDPA